MPSLKDLRNRIASVKATQKITKAMQMVAAAKLRRAQAAAEAARPYAQRMESVLANVAGGVAAGSGPELLVGNGRDQVHLLVVCTGERGLAGAFNTSIVRLAREHIQSLLNQQKTVKVLCVGRKGYEQLRRQYDHLMVEGAVDLRSVRQLGFEHADGIGKKIISMFEAGQFDVCTLFFSRFRSVIAQIPTAQQLIPAQIPVNDNATPGVQAAYEAEPGQEEILATLLPRNISVQVFKALLENQASFYGSQMSAMDNATRNAGDMIRKQTTLYNRSRQAMITKELIEIISGAEAL